MFVEEIMKIPSLFGVLTEEKVNLVKKKFVDILKSVYEDFLIGAKGLVHTENFKTWGAGSPNQKAQ